MSDNYGAYCKKCQVRSPACCGLCTVCVSELEAEIERLRETLHQIYSEACFILNSEDDDVDAWGFVKSTRDTALLEGKADE